MAVHEMMKYPRPLRIPHPEVSARADKRYLSGEEVRRLLNGPVLIEEKLDGSQLGIAWVHGKPELFTKNRHLWVEDKSPAFRGAWNWAWEHCKEIARIPKGLRAVGEWLKIRHHVPYDELPDWWVPYDIIDAHTGTVLPMLARDRIFTIMSLRRGHIDLWRSGPISFDRLLPIATAPSCFGKCPMEGIVVKAQDGSLRGKLVVQEFMDDLDNEGHWMKRVCVMNRRVNMCGEPY